MPEKEATVVIGDHTLSHSESMALRVAISSFIMTLKEGGLGDDQHGKTMTELYIKNARAVESYLIKSINKK